MNQPLPNSPQDPLAHLKDIHLPDAVGLWPPAWGWWLLSAVIITAITSTFYLLRRHRIRNAYRSPALAELRTIHTQYSAEKNAEYLQAISILLRRTALSGCGAEFNPGLKGEAWLLWLDEQYKKNSTEFSTGVGRALLIGPYQKNPEFDRSALHTLVESWIKQHRNQWQKKSRARAPSILNAPEKNEANSHV